MNISYAPDQRLKRSEAAYYLQHKYRVGSVSYLASLVTRGGGPKYEKHRHLVTYVVADLDAWATGGCSASKKSDNSNAEDSK